MTRRIVFMFMLFGLLLPAPFVHAQELDDGVLDSTINRANQLIANLGRPTRWEFQILLPSTDSAVRCPLAPGYKTETTRTPFVVTLFYDTESGNPDTYTFHVAGDGSVIQPCDPKFGGSVGMGALSSTLPQAADACTVTPSNDEFANVRQQPDVDAEQLGTITEAQTVLGRNDDTTWYLTRAGWVAVTVVNTSGDCNPDIIPTRDDAIMTLGTPAAPPADGTPVAAAPSDFTCPPNFTGYLPPRIQRGAVTAQVGAGGLPNTIRTLPTVNSERIGQIQPNRRLDFVWNGPRCSDGYVWWEVEIDGVRGWTAESSFEQDEYYLEPTTGNAVEVEVAPTPAPEVAAVPGALAPITSQNLANVQSVSTLGNINAFAWGAGQQLVQAVGSNYTLLDLNNPAAPAVLSENATTAAVTAAAFTPDGSRFAIGQANGTVLLITSGTAQPSAVTAHTAPVNTIAFSADGATMATGSGTNDGGADGWTLRLWDVNGLAAGQGDGALLRAVRFPYPVRDAAFSADNTDNHTLAIVAGTDDDAALWIYDNGGSGDNTLTVVLEGAQGAPFVTAVPQALDGDFVYARGSALYNLTTATGEERALYEQNNLRITDATFNTSASNGSGLLFITNTSEQSSSGVPLYVYEYAQLAAGGASPRVLDNVAADAIAFAPSGSLFAVHTLNNDVQVYAATQ